MKSLPAARQILGVFTALLLLFLVACDSNNDNRSDVEAVAGEYAFVEFRFLPDSDLLTPVNMLDTLLVENTRLQLFSSARFTLLYQFEGGDPTFVGGTFSVSDRRVRLNGAIDEAAFYEALLLSNETTLDRQDNGDLSADINRSVNLSAFSNRYRGLPSVDGKTILRLSRRF